MDEFRLQREGSGHHDGVFRRSGVSRGSRASNTSSGGYSFSSVYSTFSEYSSASDLSVSAFASQFDVSGLTVTAADSDVEDGFIDSSSLNPVSWARALAHCATASSGVDTGGSGGSMNRGPRAPGGPELSLIHI